MDIIEKAKEKFRAMIADFGSDPYHLGSHVPEVEKWAKKLLKKYPEADEEAVIISAWLHDVGHYPIPTEEDHAIRGEAIAWEFLKNENYPEERIEKVLHCVRSHRCKDVQPETIEAKIIAFADSVSHMTDSMYFEMAKESKELKRPYEVYGKMERDFRDAGIFPEMQAEVKEIYENWKKLIESYEKLDL